MHHRIAASAFAILTASIGPAVAQDVTLSFGATVATEFVSDSLKQSNGLAFQPFVEAEYAGFYVGASASNVSEAIIGPGNRLRYDVYAGYRTAFERFSVDLGYFRYFYNGSGDCCGEVILALGYSVSDAMELGGAVAWDHAAGSVNASATVGFALNDRLALGAGFGAISNGGHSYWSAGGSYAVSNDVSLDLTYHGHDNSVTGEPYSGLVVASVRFAFGAP